LDTIHNFALRITLVETMIGVLFAERATHEVEPIATVKVMRDQMLRIMGNTTAAGLPPQELTAIRSQLADQTNRLFNEIERRVREAPEG